MNGQTTVTTTRRTCGRAASSDALRQQGRCLLICGIVLIVIGVVLIVVTAVTVTFIIGPTIVVLVWGVICIFLSWRRINMANMMDNNPNVGNGPSFTVTTGMTTTNHPPVTVYQGQQGFASMPQTQFSTPTQYSNTAGVNATPMFSNEAPPYPTYGMYPTKGPAGAPPPPTYEDATKPS